jgi:hypothetical protein
MIFDKKWFDIISIFSWEGTEEQISIHVFRPPFHCKQFFIPVEAMESPTFWEDMHELAEKKFVEKVDKKDAPPCPRCGTNRLHWKRWYKGRSFCGFCGQDLPDEDPKDSLMLHIKIR